MKYPGGKNGSGIYHRLINLIPPHRIYVEAFLGSGAIMRLKKPAPAGSIGIDADGRALSNFAADDVPGLMLINTDALDWLTRNTLPCDCFLYLDPPYLLDTRSHKGKLYRREFGSVEEHTRLLDLITRLHCMVMISGYYSDLYAEKLTGWRTVDYTASTHAGPRTEWAWMNYPEPFALHDYRYLGDGWRKRQDIRRMQKRQLAKLKRMQPLERYAMLQAIEEWQGAATPEMPLPSTTAPEMQWPHAPTLELPMLQHS